jgi:hypothetical protein
MIEPQKSKKNYSPEKFSYFLSKFLSLIDWVIKSCSYSNEKQYKPYLANEQENFAATRGKI